MCEISCILVSSEVKVMRYNGIMLAFWNLALNPWHWKFRILKSSVALKHQNGFIYIHIKKNSKSATLHMLMSFVFFGDSDLLQLTFKACQWSYARNSQHTWREYNSKKRFVLKSFSILKSYKGNHKLKWIFELKHCSTASAELNIWNT